MGSRLSNLSVRPGQKNPIDSNTIRSSSLRDYTARAALNEAASGLQRRHGWPVRVYCWFFGYDLEAAASCLITLHSTTGNYRYGDEARQLFVDAIYMFLRADKHLSPERIDEIKRRMILGKASI